MIRLSLIALLLASCATTGTKPTFIGAPTYPKTEIHLASGDNLIHQAGRPCKTTERPEVGVTDGERTYSGWHLKTADGKLLVSAPSFLSDPAYAGEFEDYYRREDRVKVFESGSGNTIVSVEDRSPTFPRQAYILLRRDSQDKWSCRELRLESYSPSRAKQPNSPDFRGPLDNVYPEIMDVTDKYVRYSGRNGDNQVALDALPTKG
jgi:hypothetical protein